MVALIAYSPKNIEYRTRNIEFRSRGDPVWSPLYLRPESRIHNVCFPIEFAGHSGIWANFVDFQPQEVYNCIALSTLMEAKGDGKMQSY